MNLIYYKNTPCIIINTRAYDEKYFEVLYKSNKLILIKTFYGFRESHIFSSCKQIDCFNNKIKFKINK